MFKPDFVVHTAAELDGIRVAAVAAATVLEQLELATRPGLTTKAVDDLAGALISSQGGRSAFLGYRGYPGQICISLNDEVVHGIGVPDRIVRPGDLVSLDVGVELNGFIGDNARSFIVATEPSPDAARLLSASEEALMAGIAAVRAGNYVRDISAAVQSVADRAKLGVVREYVGHGCGCKLHEPPEVPNFVTRSRGPRLVPGMVLAIEPMFNLGTHKVFTESDRWTVRTIDGTLSAHFEHMVLVTETEPEILTWPKTRK
ncbi:MAG: type I methionyl aminopeptidase [Lentisphaerae bacterium GWF2_52_8]|nr:MAG: type I methionyl aminopeptidase [Lentisphaerae bacterium GWF2_52_8]